MLNFNIKVQIDFLYWIISGALQLTNLGYEHIDRLIKVTEKYSNISMDLADSSLILVSEISGITKIATIDSDYYIYRTCNGTVLENVLKSYL